MSTMVTPITRPSLLLVLLVVATLTEISSAWSIWPYKHIHVINGLTKSVLHVHCRSENDDRGYNDVAVGAEFTWRFKPHVFWTTKWTCEVSTDDQRRAIFDAYKEDADEQSREHKNNTYWVVKEDGVYLRHIEDNKDQYSTNWQ
ncbi:unnamed protein product [Linum tenue]|uniref:S-protein homolog n=1 Tax=Linum tenue TaxID=586396 RepID=A0AAV0LPU6_9ROSI|nr:unnamed protein product [Linum tenue]